MFCYNSIFHTFGFRFEYNKHTKIILADEPTGNLDSNSAKNIYNVFRDINRNLKTTIVIITHDERIAEKTDRRIRIKDGSVTE